MAKKEKDFSTDLTEGLKYPWNKAGRLWYALWLLIPIFGWLALVGYYKRVIADLVNGKRKELPQFGPFWDNFVVGLKLFIFMIPTIIVLMLISAIPFVGSVLQILISIFMLPWLIINLFMKEDFMALWELKKCFNIVFENAKEYILAYIKTLIYGIIYGILCLVIIGIPCSMFGKMYYLTEFYKRSK